ETIPRSLEIGKQSTIVVDATVDGKPSNDALIDYFLLDKDGKVIVGGKAEPSPGTIGVYKIKLTAEDTSKLSSGPNQIKIFANSIYAFRPYISERTILAFQNNVT